MLSGCWRPWRLGGPCACGFLLATSNPYPACRLWVCDCWCAASPRAAFKAIAASDQRDALRAAAYPRQMVRGGFNASVGMPDLEEPGLMARLLRAACPVPVGPGGQLAEGCCGGTRAGGWCAWTGAWAWAVQERCWPTTHPPPLGALLRGPNASGRAAWCLVRRCIRTTAVAAVGRRRAAPSAASTSSS